MKKGLRTILYYLETRYTKILMKFGIRKDASIIPPGPYCYVIDKEKNKRSPLKTGYWIKPCKYYRSGHGEGPYACTYTGFFGHDMCFDDKYKICGKNEE